MCAGSSPRIKLEQIFLLKSKRTDFYQTCLGSNILHHFFYLTKTKLPCKERIERRDRGHDEIYLLI